MASKFQETNRFVLDEFLDTFGREFCKHEVLWKPQSNCKEFGIQSATHVAYQMLAQALNLSLEAVLELLETFPAAGLDLISRYEVRRRIDAGCHMPEWLTLLAGHFRLVNKSMKCNKSAVFARNELVRALCESAQVGLGAGGEATGTEDDASPLRGPQAVAYFVARHGIKEEEVLPAWRSALELSVVKLRAVLAAGDRVGLLPPALRPSIAERALADLALLHDCSLSQITVLTPAKLRMLVLLFQLIVAAKSTYDEVRGRVGRADAGDDVLSRAVGAGRGEGGHGCSEESAPTPVESLDDEPHTELDSEPVTLVISSDTSDGKISDKYLEEYSENNIEVPVLLHEGRVEESGTDMMEKTDVSYRERESYTSSKSDSRSEYPTKNWYEESESNSSEKRRAVWALVYTDLMKRGRSASLISLQHRWVELLYLARAALLTAWNSDKPADTNVHPLLLVVAHWFPKIFTEKLPSWKRLVLERQIVLESDVKDIIPKYQENDNVLLNITENLTFPDLLKKYVNNENVPPGQSEINAPIEHVSSRVRTEPPTGGVGRADNDLQPEPQSQDHAINHELNVNSDIITTLEQIDPSQAKVSIVILEDSDEDGTGDKDDGGTKSRETAPDLNNLHVANSERGATHLREETNHISYTLENCNNLTEIAMKNIEKEQKDNPNYINNTNINDNNKLVKDKQTGSRGSGPREHAAALPGPQSAVIDEKLVNVSRIVVTPIEHLPEWKKHSRNGVIKCRNFSVRNFTKPVVATSKQWSKCTPYVSTGDEECETDNRMKNEGRIKFEDDSFETDFAFGDDINNGIKYQKYIELYSMPERARRHRIHLTRTLQLSRTYFSMNFWSLDSNIELLKVCRPVCIKVTRGVGRVAKRVELSDISEVRRINRSLLTAQVWPSVDSAAPRTQRSYASQEAVNSTNSSISLDSGTTRKTNNSLSNAADSAELLKLLTNCATQTKGLQKSVIESVTKDITSNSNLMDSIIETMRLADKNNIYNSTLQQTPFPSSKPSDSCDTNSSKNMCPTNTFHTIQKSTEEVRDGLLSHSINNSSLEATARQIHVSSNPTRDITHLEKMDNVNNTSLEPKKAKVPNIGDLRGVILHLVKHFDTNMTHESGMKLNRSSLNLHLKNFERQQRVLVKNISNLAKNLPQYVLNVKPKRTVTKNATAANKQKNINRITWKQSKEVCTLPSSHTENISDVPVNANTVFVDDDCEPNLVIDERSSELRDNIDLNNSQCNKINTNKNIQETCNRRKNDKKEKNIKKAKRKFKKPKKVSENEKPVLNEYQEWHRQKTMALKYFTLPTFDTSKLTSKDKAAQQKSTTTPIEHQSNGCQTNITIKRTNTEDLATTSTVSDRIKRSKLPSNESNVVFVSDSSSDDDMHITDCYIAKDTNESNPNTTQPDIHPIDKTDNGNKIVIFNDSSQKQAANPAVCVINPPVAESTQPVYLIINDTQLPTATAGALSKTQDSETINNPIVFQVLLNGTVLPTLTQVAQQNKIQQAQTAEMNEKCKQTNKCNCIKCENICRDAILTCTLDVIQNLTSLDSMNNAPSTSLPTQNEHPIKEAITVKEYLAGNKKLTVLIKVDRSEKLVFFCSKYIILTDVNIPSVNATYRTTVEINNKKTLSRVLVPSDSSGGVLLLGPKNESDYIHCDCLKGARAKCNLCQRINMGLPDPTKLIKIGRFYYKNISESPIKYVRLNDDELVTNSRSVLEGNPDLILVNKMFFKKLTDSPSTYVRILSALPDAATLRHLVRKEVVLYAFNVAQTDHSYSLEKLQYAQTDGRASVQHTDDELVKVLHWVLK